MTMENSNPVDKPKELEPSKVDVQKIFNIFTEVDYIVNKSYLPSLGTCSVVPIKAPQTSVCFFPIRKIVYDREENNIEKLANVYGCAAVAGVNVAMLIRANANDGIELYLGAYGEGSRQNVAQPNTSLLYNSFVGNFPGSKTGNDNILSDGDTIALMNQAFSKDFQAVASVTAVASARGQHDGARNENFYRGIEKVIESMPGKDYTILILAKSLNREELFGVRTELENLYTELSPFAKTTLSISQSNGDSITQTLAKSISDSFTGSKSDSLSIGESRSQSQGESRFSSTSQGGGTNIGGGILPLGISGHKGFNEGESKFKNVIEGQNEVKVQTQTTTEAHTEIETKSNGTTVTVTRTQSVQLNYENKKVSELLSSIELQLKRLRVGEGLGMFAVSAYFSAPTIPDTKTVAAAYKSVISGDNTHVEQACVNIWSGEAKSRVIASLRNFSHPVFRLKNAIRSDLTATPATIVSVPELAFCMNLPKKSVNRIPVCEGVSFGRNVVTLTESTKQSKQLELGNIFHLGLTESTVAELNMDSLTMHTFITGTTGSGKSNTVYGLLERIRQVNSAIHFLVVEPAKGEYKRVFGNKPNVTVYGLNYKVSPLLKINPFRFREGVHVLEHLDKLISIFNVCWPMEAAMPAILKQALERAYERAGWDLRLSENSHSQELFPTFIDVMEEVEEILNSSLYSEENKGNYIGALCTRLRELTTGLNSMVFVADDLSDEELFDSNVVVDLSRIGSAETKSLLMGLLIIRLQEYRQTTQRSIHTGLSHVTVLEEAHHLLRRISEALGSSSLASKSVEMLTNAFAEMRSAGEGFIIADQSPGLMDMSVIRNTNTKIVLRLPAFEDRQQVGKAMGLNDLQIAELSRLPTGVAAVYQNDWLSSVLVQMPYHKVDEKPYDYTPPSPEELIRSDEKLLLNALMHKNGVEVMVDKLEGKVDDIVALRLPTKVKCRLIDYVRNTDVPKLNRLGQLAFEFFNMREAALNVSATSIAEWKEEVLLRLRPSLEGYDDWDKETLLLVLSSEYSRRVREFEPIYLSLVEHIL